MKLGTMFLFAVMLLAVMAAPMWACNPPVQQFAAPVAAPVMSYQMQTVQTFAAPVQQVYSMPVQQFAAPVACQASFAAPVQRFHTASFAAPVAVQSGFLGASAGNASAGIGFGGGSFQNFGKIKIKNGRRAGSIR